DQGERLRALRAEDHRRVGRRQERLAEGAPPRVRSAVPLPASTPEPATPPSPMGELPDDLLEPGIELVETHISWVFLDGGDVYKVKKPVDLVFLDFRGIEQRRRACDAETELNRRLAPSVYLGVVPVTRRPDGHLRLGGEGAPVDWAVHMRRLPEA